MNRLTTRDIKRNVVEVCDCENKSCCEVCNDHNTTCFDCPIDKAFEKLAAYEESGMDPDEISAMMAEYTALIEQAGNHEAIDPELEKVFADYIGLYDSIHVLQYGGILDEEEVQICEHNLLFQIIGMMHANVSRERVESLRAVAASAIPPIR